MATNERWKKQTATNAVKPRYDFITWDGRLEFCRHAVAEGVQVALEMRIRSEDEVHKWAERSSETASMQTNMPPIAEWLHYVGARIGFYQTVWEILRRGPQQVGPVDMDYEQWALWTCDHVQITEDGKSSVHHTTWHPHGPDEPWPLH